MASCPRCGRGFKGQVGLGVHQARPGPCYDHEAKLQRARDREARRPKTPARRAAQKRALQEFRLRNPDYGKQWRAAHQEAERERQRLWRVNNPDLLRAQRRRHSDRHRVDRTPLPPSHTGHGLFDQAWAILDRLGIRRDDHLVSFHDTFWEEACSIAVLALLEEQDAERQVREFLKAEKRLWAVLRPLLDQLT